MSIQSLKEECEIPPELLEEEESLGSDKQIARMLQEQYDKEHDDILKHSEEKRNGALKIPISLSNYSRARLNSDSDSESEPKELKDVRYKKDCNNLDTVMREFHLSPSCSYKDNSNMIIKHYVKMHGRRDVPEFETGDSTDLDKKICKAEFNIMKKHLKHEKSKKHRMHDRKEYQETDTFGIDSRTRIILYKLVNNGMLERVNGVISVGKEAVVLHADPNPHYTKYPLPTECAIKVFKTTLSEYKHRDKYTRDDRRFKDKFGKARGKTTTSKLVQFWASREVHNLKSLQKAGILCPKVVILKQHVLVMSFIGKQNEAAPKLMDATLNDVEIVMAYEQILEYMKAMYKECNLIHADFSEYNILWYDNNCYVIDVSQAVEPSHENAFDFLYHDCEKISNFFSKRSVPNVITAKQLFIDITGYDYSDKVGLVKPDFTIE